MSSFSYTHYRKILSTVKRKYRFIPMFEGKLVGEGRGFAMLRHDIDFFLEPIEPIMEIENEEGIKANYFFRLDAMGYNLLNIKNARLLRRISEAGHEVGLHYSISNGIKCNNELFENIKFQKQIFEQILGKEVKIAAPHEPARLGLVDSDKESLPFVDAYDPSLMSNFKYLSDSGGRWREGDPLNWLEERNLYFLTHPLWWFDETPMENY